MPAYVASAFRWREVKDIFMLSALQSATTPFSPDFGKEAVAAVNANRANNNY